MSTIIIWHFYSQCKLLFSNHKVGDKASYTYNIYEIHKLEEEATCSLLAATAVYRGGRPLEENMIGSYGLMDKYIISIVAYHRISQCGTAARKP